MLPASPLAKPGENNDPNALERLRLLIVDDDEGPRQSLWFLFKGEYEVLLAESGSQALELLKSGPVDAAILDIRMPEMSGLELMGNIKKKHPETEVIFLTGYESVETARQALRLGARDYLSKPFDVVAMRSAVAAAVERRLIAGERRASGRLVEELRESLRDYRLRVELASQRGDLYAAAFHDMNNPLTYIVTMVELLAEEMARMEFLIGQDLERVRQTLLSIRQCAHACSEIASRYLKMFRSESTAEARAPVNQALTDLEVLLRRHPGLQQSTLEFQRLPTDADVKLGGIELLQILLNLALNALECLPPANLIKIRAGLVSVPMRLADFADQPGSCFLNREGFVNVAPLVRLDVEDNGPGIELEDLGRIFEPHFTTKSAKGENSGLGLTIVHKLVTHAKGALYLRTAKGLGSCFSIFLPAWP